MEQTKRVSIELPKNARIIIESDDFDDDIEDGTDGNESEHGEPERKAAEEPEPRARKGK